MVLMTWACVSPDESCTLTPLMVSVSFWARAPVWAVPAVTLARVAAALILTANEPVGDVDCAVKKEILPLLVLPLMPAEPLRTLLLLNCVLAAMLSMVLRALVICAWSAARAPELLAPLLAADTASERICVSRSLMVPRAPSVVCTIDTACEVLLMAVCKPAIWLSCCSEMTSPAGLSAPELIVYPVDNCSID